MTYDKIRSKQFRQAKEEGRICSHCGYMISIKNWKKGYKLCAGCYDALKGVNISWGYCQPSQEKLDMTGEMS